MKNLTEFAFAFSPVLLLISSTQADVLFVDSNLASGANNGDTWADAYQGPQGLQSAIAAALPGDHIYVAQGMYKPTATLDRTVSFEWKAGVQIYGGFLGNESNPYERPPKGAAPTILSGDLDGNDMVHPSGLNSYHVVQAIGTDSDSLLDRMVIQGGLTNDTTATFVRGAGLYSDQVAALRLKDCEFRSNFAFGFVGGSLAGQGGAAYLSAVSVDIQDCDFLQNSSIEGGGVFLDSLTSGRIDRCRFFGNTANRIGGGLFVLQAESIEIHNSLFALNEGILEAGGGIGMLNVNDGSVLNCTIVQNNYSIGSIFSSGYGIHNVGPKPAITNCIVWGNGPLGSFAPEDQIDGGSWTYSLVENGPVINGNLNVAPNFVYPAAGNYELTASSPGVDAGNNLAVDAAAYSLGHGHRFVESSTTANTGQGSGAIVDMGAYEYSALAAHFDCQATPNSTTQSARMRVDGSNDLFFGNFTLYADFLPSNQFGYFLASQTQGFVPLPGISSGRLCLGGSIGRLNQAFQIQSSGSAGSFGMTLILGSIPQPSGPVPVLAGQTWYFQAWFRDNANGTGDSNFTDRVGIEFE